MLVQPPRRRRPRDEAEKPFWISFSDLMTALMVLFLVAMAVGLLLMGAGVIGVDKERSQVEGSLAAMPDPDSRHGSLVFRV